MYYYVNANCAVIGCSVILKQYRQGDGTKGGGANFPRAKGCRVVTVKNVYSFPSCCYWALTSHIA